jgi:hypothetical protein
MDHGDGSLDSSSPFAKSEGDFRRAMAHFLIGPLEHTISLIMPQTFKENNRKYL